MNEQRAEPPINENEEAASRMMSEYIHNNIDDRATIRWLNHLIAPFFPRAWSNDEARFCYCEHLPERDLVKAIVWATGELTTTIEVVTVNQSSRTPVPQPRRSQHLVSSWRRLNLSGNASESNDLRGKQTDRFTDFVDQKKTLHNLVYEIRREDLMNILGRERFLQSVEVVWQTLGAGLDATLSSHVGINHRRGVVDVIWALIAYTVADRREMAARYFRKLLPQLLHCVPLGPKLEDPNVWLVLAAKKV